MYKLKGNISLYKIKWDCLSKNPNAIQLLEENPDKIDWTWLSENPNAIHLFEKNLNYRSKSVVS